MITCTLADNMLYYRKLFNVLRYFIMTVKDIGIKKNRVLISFLLVLVTIAVGLTSIFMWWEYASQDKYKYYIENAIEVEATITQYGIHWIGMYGRITNMKATGVLFILCIMEHTQQSKKQENISEKK